MFNLLLNLKFLFVTAVENQGISQLLAFRPDSHRRSMLLKLNLLPMIYT